MLQHGEGSPYEGSPAKMFHGIRFFLLGFNPAEEAMIRSKLVNGGGVSVSQYGPSCTHVIVGKIVYDDSLCVAARGDGKTVVTALWVDHSFDIGMPVDASSILYSPAKDLNGILGAKSFCVCLTGYQRQDREDIMRMVGLMGAHFSKPLVANKVTHLVCYKFEGEKYELAKKMKKIKLVNHRWLEDCLKAWEILPEYNYDKSGHEIEVMEAEAKDSEDETEDRNTKQNGVGTVAESPKLQSRHETSISKVSELPMTRELSEVHENAAGVRGLLVTDDVVPEKKLPFNSGKDIRSDKAPVLSGLNKNERQDRLDTGAYCGNAMNSGSLSSFDKTPNLSSGRAPFDKTPSPSNGRTPFDKTPNRSNDRTPFEKTPNPSNDRTPFEKTPSPSNDRTPLDKTPIPSGRTPFDKTHNPSNGGELPTDPINGKRSFHSDATNINISCSRKIPKRSPVSMLSDELSSHLHRSLERHLEEHKNGSLPESIHAKNALVFCQVQTPRNESESHGTQVNDGMLPQKRKLTLSGTSSRSPKKGSPKLINCYTGSTSANARPEAEGEMVSLPQMKSSPSVRSVNHPIDEFLLNSMENQSSKLSKTQLVNMKPLKCGLPVLRTMISDNNGSPSGVKMSDSKTSKPNSSWSELIEPNLAAGHDVGDSRLRRSTDQDGSSTTRNSEAERSRSPATLEIHSVKKDGTPSRSGAKKMGAKKSLSSRPKLGSGSSKELKQSLKNTVTPNKATFGSDEGKHGQKHEQISCVKPEMVGPTLKADTVIEHKAKGNPCLENVIADKIASMDDETEAPEEENVKKSVNDEVAEPNFKADISIDATLERMEHSGNAMKRDSVSTGDETMVSEKDGADLEKATYVKKVEVDRLTCKADQVKEMMKQGKCPSTETKKNTLLTMKETETSVKDKARVELDKRINDEKLELDKTEVLHLADKLSVKEADKPMDAEEDKQPIEKGGPSVTSSKYFRKKVVSKKHRRPMPNTKVAGATDPYGMLVNGGKCPSNESKKDGLSAMKEIETCEEGEGVEIEIKIGDEKMKMEKEKGLLCPPSKTKCKTVSANKTKKSIDADKENKPITDGGPSVNSGKHRKKMVTVKSKRTPMQINTVTDSGRMQAGRDLNCVRSEPVCFILSGHRLLRKGFQQLIRRLKGRFCRDSHHWSYQATHFVVPDPLRRTEKFFAAAASGRWILKTDYLTASSQAGKFIAEEPYEWFKNGLSEDGSINLEAPRKWRVLRERTGHGAFYGMRIIIYGECIAPPLDTLKRVVKAGDGTILATSPPYTRFLKTGIHFAIISPGMPNVDLWVQEFLSHEIPCIMADYLVEYVCKPGCSLDKHILYDTNAWAEKSLANLLRRSEEIFEPSTPSDDDDRDDLICQVCESHDRGDVMLICGDEKGSTGCGIGTHIDCCDPPLEAVPEEDWFCPKCSKSRNTKSPSKSSKKESRNTKSPSKGSKKGSTSLKRK